MIFLTLLMGVVAVLYGTAGQVGGSGFVAVMTFAAFSPGAARATAFALNIVAASYPTLHLHHIRGTDWRLLGSLLLSSAPAAFLGAMISLQGQIYYGVTGVVLLLVATLMLIRVSPSETQTVHRGTSLLVGAIAGFCSGVTGVGGGVFMSSLLILIAKASPKKTATLSPPFILLNSSTALTGALLAGERISSSVLPFFAAAIIGSLLGVFIGLRFMSAWAIRCMLALILAAGAGQMLLKAWG